jgi:hypothetical protein
MTGGNEVPLTTVIDSGDVYYAAIRYGISPNTCLSTQRREVAIVAVSAIAPPDTIDTPQHFCDGVLIANLAVPNNKIVWYFDAGSTEPLPDDFVLTTRTYYAAQKAGVCESTVRYPVDVIIDEYPAPFAPSKQTICNGKIRYVSDLMVIGAGIKWFTGPNLGDPEITSPQTTLLADSVVYYAAQTAGTCIGARTPVMALDECYSPFGTIFPFVQTGTSAFDVLFVTTVKLYDAPPVGIRDKLGYLRKQSPVRQVTATFYDCHTDMPIVGAPKHPGTVGTVYNPGLPIRWHILGFTPVTPNAATISNIDHCASANLGKFTFKDIPAGDYVIEISRSGFLTRYGKITITSDEYLGHRELLAGDVNGDFMINDKDLSASRTKSGSYGTASYTWIYDFNGDKAIDATDNSIIRVNLGSYITIYEETDDWLK